MIQSIFMARFSGCSFGLPISQFSEMGSDVPGSADMFNRPLHNALDWQTWRRQLNHTGVDSMFAAKCVPNVFTFIKCPSPVH